MDETTARLVDYALAARAGTPPADAREACKRSLIDSFACALGAFDTPLAGLARGTARRYAGAQPAASVWGCGWTTSADMAAFANGTMLRLLDLSDAYRVRSGGHPSDVIAAVIAAADAGGASGAAAIAAAVAAYEVYCGCCDSVDLNTMGWDQPVYGVVGSAIGAGMLFGLDREQLGHAVGLALAPSLALLQTRRGTLSNWKNCAGANAARNAVFAALLARDGFTGPDAVFEGKSGLFDITGRFDWDLPAARGQAHRITRVNLKNFPLCAHGQAGAWAALELYPAVRGREIVSIQADVYAQTLHEMASEPSKWAPATSETADHSLPYVLAVGLADGRIDAASFLPSRLADPALAALMRKTEVTVDPALSGRFPQSSPCRLTVRTADGAIHVAEIASAKGHADHPLDAAAVAAKFRSLAQPRCGGPAAAAFLDAMQSLEEAPDIRAVLALLADTETRSAEPRA
ncbi:MmgE/PrpD family protein [Pigmentiphaga soli]|uniref:MmgE/PrpD family protein n=1 Tax=Pigmentiphaga soli TaxID=1007095 RepID=A0ABP8GEY3_9BURK